VSLGTLSAPDIHCQTCKTAIEGALIGLTGVRDVVVDIATRRVQVEFDASRIGPDRLVEAIEQQGFCVDHGVGDGAEVTRP
jgi:copper chaperone